MSDLDRVPPAATDEGKLLRLNLGCGFDLRDGYLNVDFQDYHKPDLVADVRTLETLAEGCAEEILAQDVLEHLERADAAPTLQRWNDLLCDGGTITIRTTDVIGLASLLVERPAPDDQLQLIWSLFGTQAYNGDYHLNGFTESMLRSMLHDAGFAVESMVRTDGWLLDVEAVKRVDLPELDLGPLPLMHFNRFDTATEEPSAVPAAGPIDAAVKKAASLMPTSVSSTLRPAWQKLRTTMVRLRR